MLLLVARFSLAIFLFTEQIDLIRTYKISDNKSRKTPISFIFGLPVKANGETHSLFRKYDTIAYYLPLDLFA